MDQALRGGRTLDLKVTADEALADCPGVKRCIVFNRTGAVVPWQDHRDLDGWATMKSMRPYCPPVEMDSEDPLFILHTSGSTGQAKGIVHSTAGYLLYAATTFRYNFDYRSSDVYGCMADVGWITGHSYLVYGPLCNGATTLLFESTPFYPDAGRHWQVVEKYGITIFYTSPTAIRALMVHGEALPRGWDLKSLRVLGTVGEPINPAAWRWLYGVVGNGKCSVVDTYWQTETGGHVVAPMVGVGTKPGAASVPFFGIDVALVNPASGKEIVGNNVAGALVIKGDWPGMMRTIYNNHQRYISSYLERFPGFYATGDGAYRDLDGLYWITGRLDDVLNVSGHRLGAAEIEGAIGVLPKIAESAVVPFPHPVKGEGIFAYVVKKSVYIDVDDDTLIKEIKAVVRHQMMPHAVPDHILIAADLPRTNSGKIMRRHLRKIASAEFDNFGSTETLSNPDCLAVLSKQVALMLNIPRENINI